MRSPLPFVIALVTVFCLACSADAPPSVADAGRVPHQDGATPDAATPDGTALDGTAPDGVGAETAVMDVSAPDASAPDVSAPDVSAPDVSAPDVADAGVFADAPPDATTRDGGSDGPDAAGDVASDVGACGRDVDCGAGRYCADDGRCRAQVCAPGSAACEGAAVRACNVRGSESVLTPCAPTERCAAGRCQARACMPGATECIGATLRTCDAEGAGFSSAACPARQACVAGRCAPVVCVPDESECVERRIARRCSADGQRLTYVTCPPSQFCVAGRCREPVCTPAVASCGPAGEPRVCDLDGGGWTPTPCATPANASGTRCVDGVCAPTCNSGFGPRGGACAAPDIDRCPGLDITPDGPSVTVDIAALRAATDVGTVCGSGRANVTAFRDFVLHFRLTATRDVLVSVTGGEVGGLHLRRACEPARPRVGAVGPCAFGSTTVRIEALPAGDYYVVGEVSGSSGTRAVAVTTSSPTVRPAADACPGQDISTDGSATLVDFRPLRGVSDVDMRCAPGRGQRDRPDAVYHFRLGAVSDVQVQVVGTTASLLYLDLRRSCEGDAFVSCQQILPPYDTTYRGLPAGDYYLALAGFVNETLRVTATPSGTRPPGDACPGLDVTPDGPTASIAPSALTPLGDVGLSCGGVSGEVSTGRDWVFHFRLASPRDVTLDGTGARPASVTQGLASECSPRAPSYGNCAQANTSGAWTRTYQALPAGDWYVMGESAATTTAPVTLQVTTATPTAQPAGARCADPVTVTPDGAPTTLTFPSLSTSLVVGAGTACGNGLNSPTSSARGWFARYTLTEERDVEVTMTSTRMDPIFGEVSARCDVVSGDVRACTGAPAGGTWRRLFPRQPPGTYVIQGEQTGATSVTLAVATAAPRSLAGYLIGSSPASVAWVDACVAPGAVSLLQAVDDAAATTTLELPFHFWGTSLAAGATIAVGADGWISLNGASPRSNEGTIPSVGAPNGVIAPFWTDLVTGIEGVCVATVGAAPNRRQVFQWSDARTYADSAVRVDCEVVLNEGSNTIDLLYGNSPPLGGARPIIAGIESPDGARGLPVSHRTVGTGSRIRFTPSP